MTLVGGAGTCNPLICDSWWTTFRSLNCVIVAAINALSEADVPSALTHEDTSDRTLASLFYDASLDALLTSVSSKYALERRDSLWVLGRIISRVPKDRALAMVKSKAAWDAIVRACEPRSGPLPSGEWTTKLHGKQATLQAEAEAAGLLSKLCESGMIVDKYSRTAVVSPGPIVLQMIRRGTVAHKCTCAPTCNRGNVCARGCMRVCM